MPVRIYDISKKLGLENKEVLAKAKELGITAARVASSSLDKITAEYLEQQLVIAYPNSAPQPAAPPPPTPSQPPSPEPVATPAPVQQSPVIVTAPQPEAPELEVQESTTSTTTTTSVPILEPPAPPAAAPAPVPEAPVVRPTQESPASSPPVVEPVAKAVTPPPPVQWPAVPKPAPPPPPPSPPEPQGPKLGDKVGFIQLPPKPGPKLPEKPGPAKLPTRPIEPRRAEFNKRGDIRSVRGAPAPSGPSVPGAKFSPAGKTAGKAEPTAPKISLPADAKVITIKPPIVVRELAEHLKQKPFKIIADLMQLGVFATVNQAIDELVAQRVCATYGFRFEVEKRERGSGIVHAPVKKVELDVEDKVQ
ncbi:MAG TPA: translation initiation factor IF-2 N-terminal domain-containing protein, partial [Verrucomicrobiae bacterium]|nr:translation initiation factor IF-2 N-terminal domain-containing protein [Verrucomicrobiae bacterium]